jgi:acyl-homoserine lactone acylase PvdQ
MGTFDAGSLQGLNAAPDTELVYRTTVHGPVVGYATSNGKKVAIATQRSTRGRELLAAIPFQTLSTGGVHSPDEFFKTMSGFELTFNWFYADQAHRDVLERPAAAPQPERELRAAHERNGSYEWRGWLAPMSHPHAVDPSSVRPNMPRTPRTGSARRTTTGRTARCIVSSYSRTHCRRAR